MRCPFCGEPDTNVKDTRTTESENAIRRRRVCGKCTGRFTTYERIQLRDLFVVKRNGEREEFNRDKLTKSIRLAMQKRPIASDVVDQTVSRLIRDLENLGGEDVPTREIGERIMVLLSEIDQVAYIRFASVYKDFQNARDFGDIIAELDQNQGK